MYCSEDTCTFEEGNSFNHWSDCTVLPQSTTVRQHILVTGRRSEVRECSQTGLTASQSSCHFVSLTVLSNVKTRYRGRSLAWPVTAEVRFRSHVSPCETCVEQCNTEACLSKSAWGFHSTHALNPLHLYISLIRWTNGRSLGTLQMLFRKSENIRQKNNFHALTESPVLHGGKRCRNKHSDICLVSI
jgi:hypothetical protein